MGMHVYVVIVIVARVGLTVLCDAAPHIIEERAVLKCGTGWSRKDAECKAEGLGMGYHCENRHKHHAIEGCAAIVNCPAGWRVSVNTSTEGIPGRVKATCVPCGENQYSTEASPSNRPHSAECSKKTHCSYMSNQLVVASSGGRTSDYACKCNASAGDLMASYSDYRQKHKGNWWCSYNDGMCQCQHVQCKISEELSETERKCIPIRGITVVPLSDETFTASTSTEEGITAPPATSAPAGPRGGLSPGDISGIAIGSLALVLVIVAILVRRKMKAIWFKLIRICCSQNGNNHRNQHLNGHVPNGDPTTTLLIEQDGLATITANCDPPAVPGGGGGEPGGVISNGPTPSPPADPNPSEAGGAEPGGVISNGPTPSPPADPNPREEGEGDDEERGERTSDVSLSSSVENAVHVSSPSEHHPQQESSRNHPSAQALPGIAGLPRCRACVERDRRANHQSSSQPDRVAGELGEGGGVSRPQINFINSNVGSVQIGNENIHVCTGNHNDRPQAGQEREDRWDNMTDGATDNGPDQSDGEPSDAESDPLLNPGGGDNIPDENLTDGDLTIDAEQTYEKAVFNGDIDGPVPSRTCPKKIGVVPPIRTVDAVDHDQTEPKIPH